MLDAGCQSEGVGGFRAEGGLVVSGSVTGAGVSGGGEGLSVEGDIEPVNQVRGDLSAHAVRDQGAGDVALAGQGQAKTSQYAQRRGVLV